MPRRILLVLLCLLLSAAAWAGEIAGKVAGAAAGSVVFVNAIPGKKFPVPKKPYQVNQKNQTFVPHVLIVPVGATVDFLNQDYMRHSIYWPDVAGDKKLAHSMGSWRSGQTRSFQFTTPGVVPLLCNVHNEMRGYIIVSPTPYTAETDAAGNFRITGIPDGEYKVTAWHEGKKQQTKPVTVAGKTKADFALSK